MQFCIKTMYQVIEYSVLKWFMQKKKKVPEISPATYSWFCGDPSHMLMPLVDNNNSCQHKVILCCTMCGIYAHNLVRKLSHLFPLKWCLHTKQKFFWLESVVWEFFPRLIIYNGIIITLPQNFHPLIYTHTVSIVKFIRYNLELVFYVYYVL